MGDVVILYLAGAGAVPGAGNHGRLEAGGAPPELHPVPRRAEDHPVRATSCFLALLMHVLPSTRQRRLVLC